MIVIQFPGSTRELSRVSFVWAMFGQPTETTECEDGSFLHTWRIPQECAS
jgi:hypothetical protein